jgi:AcrR family transcriptional regulator
VIRNTNVKPRRRAYSSDLRDEQAEATRTRILDALVRTMANGVAGLSIPAVAREAGVSVPTVYRHFGSKNGLLGALGMHVGARAGLVPETLPQTMDTFEPMVRELFGNLAGMDDTLRAVSASELGREARRAAMPERLGLVRDVVDRLAPDVPDADRDRLARLVVILLSTPAFQAYRDYLGLGPDASAELVAWAFTTLVEGARLQPRSAGRGAR